MSTTQWIFNRHRQPEKDDTYRTFKCERILQSLLNVGEGPTLYVAPDPFLVDQVLNEARKLGLAIVTDSGDARYLRSEAISVAAHAGV